MKILAKSLPLILLVLIIGGCSLSKPIPKQYENIRIENGELLGYAKMLHGTKFIGITQSSKKEDNIELIKITKNGFYPNYLIKNYKCDKKYNQNICNSTFMEKDSNLGFALGSVAIGVLAQGVKVTGGSNEDNKDLENTVKVLGGLIGFGGVNSFFEESKTFNVIKFLEIIRNNRLEDERKKLLNLSVPPIPPIKPNIPSISKIISFNLKILNIPSPTSDEYIDLTLEVSHKNTIRLDKSIIYLNGTQINPKKIRADRRVNNKTYRYYSLGVPKGKNIITAKVTTLNSGDSNTDTKNIESTFNEVPTLHIVAVGVNRFPQWEDYDPSVRLKNSKNNVKELSKVFNEKSSFLFDGKLNIIPYITKKEDIKATVEKIRSNIRPNDYFVMYVATHGNIKDNKYYFAPSDFDKKRSFMKNEFKEEDLNDYLINIQTIFRLVVLDTCHSGKQINNFTEELKRRKLGVKGGVTVLAASQTDKQANADYNDKGIALFTYVLIEGLNGKADYNNDYLVDSLEISKYLEKEVVRLSQTQKHQHTAVTYSNKRFDLTLLDKNRKPNVLRPNSFTRNELNQYLNQIEQSVHKPIASFIQGKMTKIKVINKILTTGSLDTNINFDIGKSTLKNKEIDKLAIVAQALKDIKLKNKQIIISGHTDNTGSSNIQQRKKDNLILSQKRANNVMNILVNQFGVNPSSLKAIGYGESMPLTYNNIENRRVNFAISKN